MILKYMSAQIILESLPISSSIHTLLLGLTASQAVDFVSHGPTVILLALYFGPELLQWLPDMYWGKAERQAWWQAIFPWALAATIVELITCFFYIAISFLHPALPLPVGLGCTILLLLSLLFVPKGTHRVPSWRDAFFVGLAQGVSLLGGISRLASTYVVARWCGIEVSLAFRFSWLVGAPLFAAASLAGFWFLSPAESTELYTLFALATIVASLIISGLLLKLSELLALREKWWYFGVYLFIPFTYVLFWYQPRELQHFGEILAILKSTFLG